MLSKRNKLLLVTGLVLIILLSVFWWFFGHSTIEVVASDSKETKFTIRNQASGESFDILTSGRASRIVPKGNYEVIASQDSAGFFNIVSTRGFLAKTTLNPELKQESARMFIGDNPDPCMSYLSNVLISFVCGGPVANIQVHVRPSGKNPTYTSSLDVHAETSLINIIKLGEQSYAFLEDYLQGDDVGYAHSFVKLSDELDFESSTPLKELSKSNTYKYLPYGGGFLAHSNDLAEFWAFDNPDATPKKLELPSVDGSLRPYIVSSNQKGLVVGNTDSDEHQHLEETSGKVENIFTVVRNNQATSYTIKGVFSHAVLCGTDKLCLITDGKLVVYELTSKNAVFLYSASNVQNIESLGNNLLLINDKGVIDLDVDKSQGYFGYSFGGYSYCGVANVGDNYILCLINPDQQKVAIHIDASKPNLESIDKKVLELRSVPGVIKLSVYENSIYVVPDRGELVYDSATNTFDFDRGLQQTINQAVQDEAIKQGIDLNKYKIINTLL